MDTTLQPAAAVSSALDRARTLLELCLDRVLDRLRADESPTPALIAALNAARLAVATLARLERTRPGPGDRPAPDRSRSRYAPSPPALAPPGPHPAAASPSAAPPHPSAAAPPEATPAPRLSRDQAHAEYHAALVRCAANPDGPTDAELADLDARLTVWLAAEAAESASRPP
ncbi:MAG: hypothetical protein KIT68_09915 [Phycisphaeraceae bacterium]|nr:hypothetical protein [Phycisphaeraceae bacterium]